MLLINTRLLHRMVLTIFNFLIIVVIDHAKWTFPPSYLPYVEMQVKFASINSASQPTTGKDEHFIKEHEKRKTPPNTPPAVHQEPQKQAKVNRYEETIIGWGL